MEERGGVNEWCMLDCCHRDEKWSLSVKPTIESPATGIIRSVSSASRLKPDHYYTSQMLCMLLLSVYTWD